jgi:hypothetical protein
MKTNAEYVLAEKIKTLDGGANPDILSNTGNLQVLLGAADTR